MPLGTHHRLTGILLSSPRGLVLQMDDGGVYALDVARSATRYLGLRVTVEGTRSGFDRIDVDWIGEASSDKEGR